MRKLINKFNLFKDFAVLLVLLAYTFELCAIPNSCLAANVKSSVSKPPTITTQKDSDGKPPTVTAQQAGDGKSSTVTAQKTGDGKSSTVTAQKTGDGKPPTVTAQKDSDGKSSTITAQKTGDGKSSIITAQKTGDGKPPTITAQTTGDGKPSIVTAQKTGDGKSPTITAKKAGDGKPPTITAQKTGDGRPPTVTAQKTGDGESSTVTGWQSSNSKAVDGTLKSRDRKAFTQTSQKTSYTPQQIAETVKTAAKFCKTPDYAEIVEPVANLFGIAIDSALDSSGDKTSKKPDGDSAGDKSSKTSKKPDGDSSGDKSSKTSKKPDGDSSSDKSSKTQSNPALAKLGSKSLTPPQEAPVEESVAELVDIDEIMPLNVMKADEYGTLLSGAEFMLTRLEDDSASSHQPGIFKGLALSSEKNTYKNATKEKYYWTSDKSKPKVLNLKPGKYALKELKSPNGYIKLKNSFVFNVDEHGRAFKDTTNSFKTTKLRRTKTSPDGLIIDFPESGVYAGLNDQNIPSCQDAEVMVDIDPESNFLAFTNQPVKGIEVNLDVSLTNGDSCNAAIYSATKSGDIYTKSGSPIESVVFPEGETSVYVCVHVTGDNANNYEDTEFFYKLYQEEGAVYIVQVDNTGTEIQGAKTTEIAPVDGRFSHTIEVKLTPKTVPLQFGSSVNPSTITIARNDNTLSPTAGSYNLNAGNTYTATCDTPGYETVTFDFKVKGGEGDGFSVVLLGTDGNEGATLTSDVTQITNGTVTLNNDGTYTVIITPNQKKTWSLQLELQSIGLKHKPNDREDALQGVNLTITNLTSGQVTLDNGSAVLRGPTWGEDTGQITINSDINKTATITVTKDTWKDKPTITIQHGDEKTTSTLGQSGITWDETDSKATAKITLQRITKKFKFTVDGDGEVKSYIDAAGKTLTNIPLDRFNIAVATGNTGAFKTDGDTLEVEYGKYAINASDTLAADGYELVGIDDTLTVNEDGNKFSGDSFSTTSAAKGIQLAKTQLKYILYPVTFSVKDSKGNARENMQLTITAPDDGHVWESAESFAELQLTCPLNDNGEATVYVHKGTYTVTVHDGSNNQIGTVKGFTFKVTPNKPATKTVVEPITLTVGDIAKAEHEAVNDQNATVDATSNTIKVTCDTVVTLDLSYQDAIDPSSTVSGNIQLGSMKEVALGSEGKLNKTYALPIDTHALTENIPYYDTGTPPEITVNTDGTVTITRFESSQATSSKEGVTVEGTRTVDRKKYTINLTLKDEFTGDKVTGGTITPVEKFVIPDNRFAWGIPLTLSLTGDAANKYTSPLEKFQLSKNGKKLLDESGNELQIDGNNGVKYTFNSSTSTGTLTVTLKRKTTPITFSVQNQRGNEVDAKITATDQPGATVTNVTEMAWGDCTFNPSLDTLKAAGYSGIKEKTLIINTNDGKTFTYQLLDKNGNKTSDGTLDEQGLITLTLEYILHEVPIRVVDTNSIKRVGCGITLEDTTEGKSQVLPIDSNLTSEETEKTVKLPMGKYKVSHASQDKHTGTELAEFEVKPDGKIVINGNEKYVVELTCNAKVKLTETFEHKGGSKLKGTTIITTNADRTEVHKITIEADGKWKIDMGLPSGTYTVSMKEKPSGYQLHAPVTFTVSNDGSITKDQNWDYFFKLIPDVVLQNPPPNLKDPPPNKPSDNDKNGDNNPKDPPPNKPSDDDKNEDGDGTHKESNTPGGDSQDDGDKKDSTNKAKNPQDKQDNTKSNTQNNNKNSQKSNNEDGQNGSSGESDYTGSENSQIGTNGDNGYGSGSNSNSNNGIYYIGSDHLADEEDEDDKNVDNNNGKQKNSKDADNKDNKSRTKKPSSEQILEDSGVPDVDFNNMLPGTESVKTLTAYVTLGGQNIQFMLQDYYNVLPDGTYFDVKLIKPGTDRYKEITKNQDNTHEIENATFFEITLYKDISKKEKLSMPLKNKVRVLMQVPFGWDAKDTQAVLVKSGIDGEFEEKVEVINGVEYVAFWSDHFSPYAFIDVLTDSEKGVTSFVLTGESYRALFVAVSLVLLSAVAIWLMIKKKKNINK